MYEWGFNLKNKEDIFWLDIGFFRFPCRYMLVHVESKQVK